MILPAWRRGGTSAVRSCLFTASRSARWRLNCRCHSSTTTPEPLRILFCGSDDFSIASLTAVYDEHRRNPDLIASIDVVHRPGKRVGRGLKQVREVPIAAVAQSLSLPTHILDTFTGWTPPTPINLIIAVSFGLLVPPRLLALARYGGLNVHPSLLPNLRGPAPLHHALLNSHTHIGISLQTLHPTTFDAGAVLLQTPAPGLPIPDPDRITPAQLEAHLAPIGADMLVQGLRQRLFEPPIQERGWWGRTPDTANQPLLHAAKITKRDQKLPLRAAAAEVRRLARVLGDLWALAPPASGVGMLKFHAVDPVTHDDVARERLREQHAGLDLFDNPALQGGLVLLQEPGKPDAELFLVVAAEAGEGNDVLRVTSCTAEGLARGKGWVRVRKALKEMGQPVLMLE